MNFITVDAKVTEELGTTLLFTTLGKGRIRLLQRIIAAWEHLVLGLGALANAFAAGRFGRRIKWLLFLTHVARSATFTISHVVSIENLF